MNISVYLYHNIAQQKKMYKFHCIKCGRILLEMYANQIVISNSGLADPDKYDRGSKYIQLQCHSCITKYNVLFQ